MEQLYRLFNRSTRIGASRRCMPGQEGQQFLKIQRGHLLKPPPLELQFPDSALEQADIFVARRRPQHPLVQRESLQQRRHLPARKMQPVYVCPVPQAVSVVLRFTGAVQHGMPLRHRLFPIGGMQRNFPARYIQQLIIWSALRAHRAQFLLPDEPVMSAARHHKRTRIVHHRDFT